MSCETVIYEVELINDDYDVLLNYKDCVSGYDFLETIYSSQTGYQSISAKELKEAFENIKREPSFEINEDKDYVIYISY